MATVPLLVINQRTDDGAISIETNLPNPLIILDLLNTVQKQYIQLCATQLEPKKESQIITNNRIIHT